MANMLDYVDWRGDLSFSEVGFNEVDNLVLSSICYVDFENIVSPSFAEPELLRTAARKYLLRHKGEKAYLGAIVPSQIVALMAKASKSKRFGNIRVCGYINHISDKDQTQFSAITYIIDEKHICVAFRGTDDTIIGWKENFNMSFMHPVPAQIEAVSYLEEVAKERKEDIYVAGHSKGGNLAAYAVTKCKDEVRERVLCAFNNDGPGFTHKFITSEAYKNAKPKIRTIIPESSVVGMLLEHEESYQVIKSCGSGIFQHDPISWEVLGGQFIHLDTISNDSKFIDKTVKSWLSQISADEREAFVDNLFDALASTKAKTLTDLNTNRRKLLKVWSGLDPESRSTVFKYIKLVLKEKTKSIITPHKEKTPQKQSSK